MALSPNSSSADERDSGQRLESRGDERDDHAAPHRLLVGDDVGGDDGLAVPGPDRVQDAVEERERGKGQSAGHGIVGLEALDAHGERALQSSAACRAPRRTAHRAARATGKGAATGRGAKAEGGAASVAANGLIGFSSCARRRRVKASKASKAATHKSRASALIDANPCISPSPSGRIASRNSSSAQAG